MIDSFVAMDDAASLASPPNVSLVNGCHVVTPSDGETLYEETHVPAQANNILTWRQPPNKPNYQSLIPVSPASACGEVEESPSCLSIDASDGESLLLRGTGSSASVSPAYVPTADLLINEVPVHDLTGLVAQSNKLSIATCLVPVFDRLADQYNTTKDSSNQALVPQLHTHVESVSKSPFEDVRHPELWRQVCALSPICLKVLDGSTFPSDVLTKDDCMSKPDGGEC